MQPVVFTEMCFLFHLATPTSKTIPPSLLRIHLEGPQSREVSQLSVHCILLLTRNWTLFFSLISFPILYLWNLSGWIKIDQGLLLLIKSMIWLHFTKIQTLWLSLSQHPSLWLWKTCVPWSSLTYRWNPPFFACITPISHIPRNNKAAVKRKLEGGEF